MKQPTTFRMYSDEHGGGWIEVTGLCPYCVCNEPHRHRLGIVVELLNAPKEAPA